MTDTHKLQTAKFSKYKGGPMVELSQVSSSSTLDFLLHRNSTYIFEVSFGSLWEFTKLVGGKQKCPLVGDQQLYKSIMKTTLCGCLEPPSAGKKN